jgi:aryl-alcohol dehydrogenase-like predicted oxidoreductase
MHQRRRFLRASLAGAGLLSVSPRLALSAVAARSAADRVVLGRTGIRCSFLAQGTGFNGWARASDHTRLGQPAFTRLLRHGFDEGVNFLDMADLYGTHSFVREAIRGLPRDRFVMLTKIWPRKADWVTPSGGARPEFDQFRRELGTEMIDVCLIHCAVDDRWAQEYGRMRDELQALKEQGSLRAVGVSCHDHGALKVAADDPWVDVIFARINHRGGKEFSCDDTAPEVAKTLKRARANGKAVVGMKIFGAGKLTRPEDRDASLAYVLGNDLVDAMTIGMKSVEQVDDTVARIGKALAG